ncbi:hypothetical protein KIPB_009311 [Kipferlia bialata]|uniref:Uncharacterized protein n=1 Tax=Kipferlia bialata TaxID=797122 RepID=A0A9K3D244_9EUKA|nr:hypothetical protein KIPB_009311 [Kipferlia bialata]|eukprot:g9311.t1
MQPEPGINAAKAKVDLAGGADTKSGWNFEESTDAISADMDGDGSSSSILASSLHTHSMTRMTSNTIRGALRTSLRKDTTAPTPSSPEEIVLPPSTLTTAKAYAPPSADKKPDVTETTCVLITVLSIG